jgi:hypothetical protein
MSFGDSYFRAGGSDGYRAGGSERKGEQTVTTILDNLAKVTRWFLPDPS